MTPATGLTDDEVREIRREFRALERYTYFATNGLGVLPQRAVTALQERLDGFARNGVIAAIRGNVPLADEVRGRVARLLGADAGEVAFCRNTSEGVLWVAHSLALQAGDEVLTVQGEYPSTVLPWLAAPDTFGIRSHSAMTGSVTVEGWTPSFSSREEVTLSEADNIASTICSGSIPWLSYSAATFCASWNASWARTVSLSNRILSLLLSSCQ